jgi:hypothetical protein
LRGSIAHLPYSPKKALFDSANDPTPPVGIYRSGPQIEQLFLDCGIKMRVGSSSRVPATTECLREAWSEWDDGASVQRVILHVADPRDYLDRPEKNRAVIERLNAALEADGYAVMIVGGKPQPVTRQVGGAIVSAVIEKTAILNFDTVQCDVTRALNSAADDPEDAVTAACSLIESVCRSILIELKLALPAKKDIDGLVRAVQGPLGLSPGRTDFPAEIEADVRQVLGGLTSVAKGIGALRTHGGDAHGRKRGFRRIDARIARMAINAAGSLTLFFIETWEQQQRRALPLRVEAA